jgi:hypothetical protein
MLSENRGQAIIVGGTRRPEGGQGRERAEGKVRNKENRVGRRAVHKGRQGSRREGGRVGIGEGGLGRPGGRGGGRHWRGRA